MALEYRLEQNRVQKKLIDYLHSAFKINLKKDIRTENKKNVQVAINLEKKNVCVHVKASGSVFVNPVTIFLEASLY